MFAGKDAKTSDDTKPMSSAGWKVLKVAGGGIAVTALALIGGAVIIAGTGLATISAPSLMGIAVLTSVLIAGGLAAATVYNFAMAA